MSLTTTMRFRRTAIPITALMMATSIFAAPVHAQDAAADDFLTTIADARDAALTVIDETQAAGGRACVGLAQEACLQQVVSDDIVTIAAQLESLVELLEASDVPDAHAEDVATHLDGLRRGIELHATVRDGAIAGDAAVVGMTFGQLRDLWSELAADLDPAYAEAAFLTDFGSAVDFVAGALSLTDDERAYLAAVRQAPRAAEENFGCFGRAIQVVYGNVESLLAALSECGAGEAVAKTEAALRGLEPPDRFADEHAWLLASVADQVRFDRRIGRAALEGDIVAFLVGNEQMSMASMPDLDLDPIFVRDARNIDIATIDPATPLAQTIYGRELHRALNAYSVRNPGLSLIRVLEFPQVPREAALPAITELVSDMQALDASLFSAVERLVPPPELADDHAAIVDFFEGYGARIDDLAQAAADGDAAATFAIENAGNAAYCDVTAGLSDDIRPATDPFFDRAAPFC